MDDDTWLWVLLVLSQLLSLRVWLVARIIHGMVRLVNEFNAHQARTALKRGTDCKVVFLDPAIAFHFGYIKPALDLTVWTREDMFLPVLLRMDREALPDDTPL